MVRCILCNYFFQRVGRFDGLEPASCPVCEARTTPGARNGFLLGRRIEYGYMDSD